MKLQITLSDDAARRFKMLAAMLGMKQGATLEYLLNKYKDEKSESTTTTTSKG